ncbi:MAG: electron transfer flavoprotein beta subunit/FixA family protein, partial [Ilumatobacteraceae bacterium]
GIRIAVALGRPMVNGAKSLDVENGLATIRREADAGQELYTLPLPACVGIREGINLPRYPTMKGRLASKKVTIARSEVSAEAGGQRMILLRRPAEKASTTVILGTGPEAASAVVDLLGELGVLR